MSAARVEVMGPEKRVGPPRNVYDPQEQFEAILLLQIKVYLENE